VCAEREREREGEKRKSHIERCQLFLCFFFRQSCVERKRERKRESAVCVNESGKERRGEEEEGKRGINCLSFLLLSFFLFGRP
jgi:hypothetical protein